MLADIAELVRSLPEEPATPPASRPTTPPAAPATTRPARAAETRTASARTTRARPAAPANPSRHWVQVAGGANRAALPREFERLKALAPDQLGRRTPYTAPLRATNRLLVGPFASTGEAQSFVNQLARHNITAFAWTSEAGQEIERLQTGR
ncbi:MAG: SPOR domain-containing protein [Allosphingosinicella sp.]